MKQCCLNCGNYHAYYIKGVRRFIKEDKGKCTAQKEKSVSQFEDCKHWKSNEPLKIAREVICLNALEEALTNIAELKQIMSEEYEEKRTENATT